MPCMKLCKPVAVSSVAMAVATVDVCSNFFFFDEINMQWPIWSSFAVCAPLK